MIKRIVWTTKALITFENSITYLESEYAKKESDNFIKNTASVIKNISDFPQMYAKDYSLNINKAPINKTISLIYREKSDRIEIIYFWNNKQNPAKLKSIVN
ncbi:MAG: hypothetical protein L3J41_11415 [Melioribacteraceae bacterium]|nr:hypothetical protein [Melioribacteraceae bacterium]